MKTRLTPRSSARGSDFRSPRLYLLKDLRAELRGHQARKESGFTKRVYVLSAIDLETLNGEEGL